MDNNDQILVRPWADEFLQEMSKYYEIVIFTAGTKEYADWILDQLDTTKAIKYRLYRQHATPCETTYVKDLSRLGRPLNRVIIVDNLAENFQRQPDNGIMIKTWYDDPKDNALIELAPILKGIITFYIEIVVKKIPDVRDALGKFCDQMSKQSEKGVSKFHFSLDN